MVKKLKLTIELVPKTSWCNNVRKIVSKSSWNEIRQKANAKCDNKCSSCGSEGRLNCHEIWQYDDQNYIQRLIGFTALCNLCHHVKHLGIAIVLANQGKLNYDRIVKHFMRVNNCDRATLEEYRIKAFDQWRSRSQHDWKVELGEYEHLIQPKTI